MEARISIITLGVKDLAASYRFYHHGLGLPTSGKPDDNIIFFQTGGTRLALYPMEELAADVSPVLSSTQAAFSGITLAHNTRRKEQVDQILQRAEQAGAKIEKAAQETFWGGYSGYFSDPDGYLWEIAYADSWKFNADGSLVLE